MSKSKNQNLLSWVFVSVIAVIVLVLVFYSGKGARGNLESFAECLSEEGFVFYYSDWCPFCKTEMQFFGASFELIKSVNCSDVPSVCVAAKIESVPTWIFGDNERVTGAQGLSRLSELSNCPISQ